MRDVQRRRVLHLAGAVVLALPFIVVGGLEVAAQSTRIQQSEQILQPAGDAVEHDSFGTAVISSNTRVIGGFDADVVLIGADIQHPHVGGYPGGEAYLYRLNPRGGR